MMVRNVVVLPAPLRPTRQTSSPCVDLERDAAQHAAALDIDREITHRQHQCPLRLPITVSIRSGSAKNRSGGRSASTLPSDSAMMRCE